MTVSIQTPVKSIGTFSFDLFAVSQLAERHKTLPFFQSPGDKYK